MKTSLLAAVVSCACVGLGATAFGQLVPEKTYFGVNRPLTLTASVPAGKSGDVTIAMFPASAGDAASAVPKAKATAGPVDLASAFPNFWSELAGKLTYAQLLVGDEPVGPAVVLQPLSGPPMASGYEAGSGNVQFRRQALPLSGVRAYIDQHVVITTTLGEMEFRLRPDHAPNTAWNFRELVQGGFYTDIPFHRIIGPPAGKSDGFMAQCGDPTGTGAGGPGYNIDIEPTRLPHDFGVLSMARSNDPNSAGSQFFVCFSREGTKFLDGKYCSFAQAVRGGEVIESLSKVPVVDNGAGEQSKPVDPPKLVSAKLVDAPPFPKAPPILIKPGSLPVVEAKPIPPITPIPPAEKK